LKPRVFRISRTASGVASAKPSNLFGIGVHGEIMAG
jgi:hypothetical protein